MATHETQMTTGENEFALFCYISHRWSMGGHRWKNFEFLSFV